MALASALGPVWSNASATSSPRPLRRFTENFNSLVLAAYLRDIVQRQQSFVPWFGDRPDALLSRQWMLITLRSPIARASRTSRAAAPSSATRGFEKPARAGSEFVLNRHRRMNGTRFCDVSLELY
jgi:hypothetical protein